MGWLFRRSITRKELIAERTEGWERTNDDGLVITSTCLAHCYRGGSFSGVLWSVWERTFMKNGAESSPKQRWIQCDLLRHQNGDGWGYKDLEESCGPINTAAMQSGGSKFSCITSDPQRSGVLAVPPNASEQQIGHREVSCGNNNSPNERNEDV